MFFILKKQTLIFMRSHLFRNVLDLFFPLYKVHRKTFVFCKKKDMKGQSKSPVIVTKIKALLFVQEQSWKLTLVPTLGERRRPARWVGPHSSSAETNYIPMLCPLIQLRHLSASQLHQDPKFISKAQTRLFLFISFLIVTRHPCEL